MSVQYLPGVKLGGKVDFYINGDRQWAVELLINGESNEADFGNR